MMIKKNSVGVARQTLNERLLRIARLTLGNTLIIVAIVLIIGNFTLSLLSMINSSEVKAGAFAENIAATLVFEDPGSAQDLLNSLASADDVSVAIIYTRNHEAFASFQADPFLPEDTFTLPDKNLEVSLRHFKLVYPIMFQQETYGNFFLVTSLASIYWQTAWLTLVILVTAVIAMVVGHFMLRRLNTAVLVPLTELSNLIAQVSEKTDFNVRAESSSITELDVIAKGFNHMLEQIGQRDQRLSGQRDQLEVEVAARTAELVAAKDTAESASRAKSEFLATMSHEIRTPLNGVLGMNELLLNSELNAQQKIWAESVQLSGHHLLGVINDILDFSKIESGRMQLESVDFDMVNLVEEAVAMFSQQAKDKELELVLQFLPPNTPLNMRGDPFRLRQVIINLISNAIKFTQKGEVVVRTVLQEETDHQIKVCICVEDTGIGIAPGAINKVFEHFSQADAKTTRQYGGTGLGLAICKLLVELMNGHIWVESTSDKGSKFFMELRLDKASQSFVSKAVDVRFKEVCVLVVDDNQTNREILVNQLQSWNMCVYCASGSVEALHIMHQSAKKGLFFQLVILDMHMPGMDGLQLAREIRSYTQFAHSKLMMLTSTVTDSKQLKSCVKLGVVRFLYKPIRQSDLYNVIFDILSVSSDTEQAIATKEQKMGTEKLQGFVLLAEDNPVNQEVARAMLQSIGVRMDLAVNGQEAYQKVKDNCYDLVFMDCQMPVMDGYEATKLIRNLPDGHGCLSIVALTANALFNDRQKCLDAGMDDFLSKPFSLAQMRAMLERWLPHQSHSENNKAGAKSELLQVTDSVVINQEKLSMLTILGAEGDSHLLKSVLSIFQSSAPQALMQIYQAIQSKDADALRQAAHTLKSSAANVGAERLSGLCQQVETYAIEKQIDAAQKILQSLQHEFDQAFAALQSRLDQMD